jgi:hypothetical protein
MAGMHYLSYFFGGVFLTNAVPHFVSGVMGRPFQSPFAKPPGQGAFFFNSERALGVLQLRCWLRSYLPCWRL